MKKRILTIVLVASLILSAAGCGETGSSDEINLDNIEEKIENMSDDEIEQAVLDGAEKLEEEYGNGLEITEAVTTTAAPEPEEIVYAPTQEILDADFSSMKVQINNDIFQQGGYITVAELVEQYGDRYEFTYMDGAYEDRKDYLIEYKKFDYSTDKWFKGYPIEMTSLYGDKTCSITAYVANLTSVDEKVTLDKSYVIYFEEKFHKSGDETGVYSPAWMPKGLFGLINDNGGTFYYKKEFTSEYDNYKYSDFSTYLESLGFVKADSITGNDIDNGNADMKYVVSPYPHKRYYSIYFMGETTDFGLKPCMRCYFYFDENTDKLNKIQYGFSRFVK